MSTCRNQIPDSTAVLKKMAWAWVIRQKLHAIFKHTDITTDYGTIERQVLFRCSPFPCRNTPMAIHALPTTRNAQRKQLLCSHNNGAYYAHLGSTISDVEKISLWIKVQLFSLLSKQHPSLKSGSFEL